MFVIAAAIAKNFCLISGLDLGATGHAELIGIGDTQTLWRSDARSMSGDQSVPALNRKKPDYNPKNWNGMEWNYTPLEIGTRCQTPVSIRPILVPRR
ncbi:hypothetical protein FRC19_002564 [Serendipita sp. 401]|nr:hypothetical protein FRC19_002564 [Serendipita sp. 401]KAG9021520.1 hypothetical protein FS842_006571 [Serendipita sp. 407]